MLIGFNWNWVPQYRIFLKNIFFVGLSMKVFWVIRNGRDTWILYIFSRRRWVVIASKWYWWYNNRQGWWQKIAEQWSKTHSGENVSQLDVSLDPVLRRSILEKVVVLRLKLNFLMCVLLGDDEQPTFHQAFHHVLLVNG